MEVSAGVRRTIKRRKLPGKTQTYIASPFVKLAPVVERETYQHCWTSTELDEIRADVEHLSYVAHTVVGQKRASFFVPSAIEPFHSPLPSRRAVDPYAMTVACAVHGSEVARTAGQPEMERELLMRVVAAVNTTPVLSESNVLGNLRQHPIDSATEHLDLE